MLLVPVEDVSQLETDSVQVSGAECWAPIRAARFCAWEPVRRVPSLALTLTIGPHVNSDTPCLREETCPWACLDKSTTHHCGLPCAVSLWTPCVWSAVHVGDGADVSKHRGSAAAWRVQSAREKGHNCPSPFPGHVTVPVGVGCLPSHCARGVLVEAGEKGPQRGHSAFPSLVWPALRAAGPRYLERGKHWKCYNSRAVAGFVSRPPCNGVASGVPGPCLAYGRPCVGTGARGSHAAPKPPLSVESSGTLSCQQ